MPLDAGGHLLNGWQATCSALLSPLFTGDAGGVGCSCCRPAVTGVACCMAGRAPAALCLLLPMEGTLQVWAVTAAGLLLAC